MVSCYQYNFGPDKFVKYVGDMVDLEMKMKNYSKYLVPNQKQWVLTLKEISVTEKKRYFCEEPFTLDKEKLWDHCHWTVKCWGAAHRICNIVLTKQL